MSASRHAALDYAHTQTDRFLQELNELLRIPSISTSPDHASHMQEAAQWLASHLLASGLEKAEIFQTAGHPVVYGEWLKAGAGAPTVLIYGHYDVQPVDPLDLWKTGPFEPQVRGDNLHARGASDMKGQIIATLKAVEAVIKQTDNPGVNIKYLLEGEEEIGSPHLAGFMAEHKELLACDFALNPDAGMISPDIPAIVYGLRGLAYFEVYIYGPDHDLHSGSFGGVIHNPAVALCELIAGMHDAQGRVQLPGFYDRVRAVSVEERAQLARLPIEDETYRRLTGAPALWGEPDYSSVERVSIRPTLEVNGMLSGFTGAGSKTIIPAWAMAKISTRLVADQQIEEVHQQLIEYFKQNAPKTVRWEIRNLGGGPACRTDPKLPATQALVSAQQTVWGVAPMYKCEGGSIPIVADMQHILGVDSVLTGLSLPDDAVHSPNEKLHLPTWRRGIDAYIHFFYNLAETL